MSIDEATVHKALERIVDPQTGKSLVASDFVRALQVEDGKVRFVLEVPAERGASMEPLRKAAEEVVKALPGVQSASVLMTAHSAQPAPPSLKPAAQPQPKGPEKIEGVKRIIAVASGKGGVGKSTVSANLAVALAKSGQKVGLLDADIYGPSQHKMFRAGNPQSPDGKTMLPPEAEGIKIMSIGMMMKEGEAAVWRGPMLMGALQQLMFKVQWGDLDVLIVDLPPGTGDVQLTLAQKAKVDGAIVVSTPQDIALIDARKAIDMFDKLGVAVLGLIENMSMHVCSNCGHEEALFGHGGAEAEARARNLPFLGALPLDLQLRVQGDEGRPLTAADPESSAARAFLEIAGKLVA